MNLFASIRNFFSGATFGRPTDWANGDDVEPDSIPFSLAPESALRLIAVAACVKVIAGSIATMPIHAFRTKKSGGRERIVDSDLEYRLNVEPNEEMSSPEFWETYIAQILLWGTAYSQFEFSRTNEILGLYPINPAAVSVKRDQSTRKLTYRFGSDTVLDPRSLFITRGLSLDGVTGLSPIAYHRLSLGLAANAEKFGASFFLNASRPAGVLKFPEVLDDAAYKRIKDDWNAAHQGTTKTGSTAILEQGGDWKPITIPPNEAQFIETRKYQTNEIARIFGVPPHMIQDLEKATFSNIEHQAIQFVVHTLRPWIVRLEKSIKRSMIREREIFVKFIVDGLLRGDTPNRFSAYATARQWGWLNADEIREIEDFNPIPDGSGSVYLTPLNMVASSALLDPPADQVAARALLNGSTGTPRTGGAVEAVASNPAVVLNVSPRDLDEAVARVLSTRSPATSPAWSRSELRFGEVSGREFRVSTNRRKIRRKFAPMFAAAVSRAVRREASDLRKGAKKFFSTENRAVEDDFLRFVVDFYDSFHPELKSMILPAVDTLSELIAIEAAEQIGAGASLDLSLVTTFADEYADAAASRWISSHRAQLRELIEAGKGAEAYDTISIRLEEWVETFPDKFAANEVVKVDGAIARETWSKLGVTEFIWRTVGTSCPICSSLDGKIVGREVEFVAAGDKVEGDSDQEPISPRRKVLHPPLHGGCDCFIEPA